MIIYERFQSMSKSGLATTGKASNPDKHGLKERPKKADHKGLDCVGVLLTMNI